ncbi:TonB-dependent receptor [Gluconacetobacter sacchari]|uniref:TonB-dependent receptor n=1 Tax=Gluconacetobacter sacchari TaxID=92759 RepID=UPI0039B47583
MRRSRALVSGLLLGTMISPAPVLAATHDFDIATPSLPAALALYEKATGIGVIANARDTGGIRAHAIKGVMDDRAALSALLAGSPLVVGTFDGRSAVIRRKPDAPARAVRHVRDDEYLDVVGRRSVVTRKRNSDVLVDSIAYNDTSSLGGGAASVADLLVLLPGVTGIQDGDEPRYVSVRGISPDLNQTTLNGITLATIGDNGGGTRRVNLQNIPGELTGEDDIYKTFTAEQDGGAIGAVIDMTPRSAFDYKGLYKYFTAYGVYNTYKGAAGVDRIPGQAGHLAQGAKGVLSDRFGRNGEFGVIVSVRYQNRVRNSYKNWQTDSYFYDDHGLPVGGESNNIPSRALGWNGLEAPQDIEYGNYSNSITNLGGSGRLDWRPGGSGVQASLMGYTYERWEHSAMNHTYLLLDNPQIWDQTPTSGRELIYRSASYIRRDRWQTDSSGVLGDLGWHDALSALKLRVGYTWEDYRNYQPRLTAYAYPKKQGLYPLYADYEVNDDFASMTGVSDPGKLRAMKYNLSQIQRYHDNAREGVTNVRLDYTRNIGPRARGFGLAAGFEWRTLNVTDRMEYEDYVAGGDASAYMYFPNFLPPGSRYTLPWIDMGKFPWSAQKLDVVASRNDSLESFYRYREQLIDGYLSLHYKWRDSLLIAGVRADSVSFNSLLPQVSNGNATGTLGTNRGGYLHPLPSVTFVHDFPYDIKLRASYSQSVGRPMPSQIAQVQKMTCGDDERGGTECTLSRGNPNLQPRRAQNFDASVEKYFNHNHGVASVAYFDKMIKHDIYTLLDHEMINGMPTSVTEPLNATNSSLMGVEGSVVEEGLRGPFGQRFDVSVNGTWMHGSMIYASSSGSYTLHQLPDQPNYIFNGAVTWRVPQMRGAVRATLSYTPKYLTDPASQPWENVGYGELASLDLAAWNDITDHVRLKYEVDNLVGAHRTYVQGTDLQRINEKDYYGRSIYFQVVVD